MRRRPWVRLAVAFLAALACVSGCSVVRHGARTPAVATTLRVGTSADYPPFSYRRSDGTLAGFDVDVAHAYAADRGLLIVFVPFRWPELRARLLAGELDVAMSGVTVRGDRLADGVMTGAVARSTAVLVAAAPRRRRGAPPSLSQLDRRGSRIVVNRGGHLERVARARIRRATIVTVDDNRALPCALRDGSADAVVTDTLELASFATEEAAQRCDASASGVRATPAGAPAASPRIVAALSHDRKAYWSTPRNADLAADVDEWLRARERDGTLAALRARHFGSAAAPEAPGDTDGATVEPLRPDESELVDLVGRRLLLMPLVARAKDAAGLPVEDRAREGAVEAAAAERARKAGLDVHAYRAFVRAQIEAAKAVQHAALRDEARSRAVARERARLSRRHVEGIGAAPAASAGRTDEDPTLETLRGAIDRIDTAILAAAARARPIVAGTAAIEAALRRDAEVPGFDDAVARGLAKAVRSLTAARAE